MRELKNIVTKTYEYKDGFRIDIVIDTDKQEYEVFLYHERYGIKDMMWGGMIEDGLDPMIEMIVVILENGTFIADYAAQYMDEEI